MHIKHGRLERWPGICQLCWSEGCTGHSGRLPWSLFDYRQLQPLWNLPLCLCTPPDPSIFLISHSPHLTPSVLLSKSLLQKLSRDAGRQAGVISACRLSQGLLSRNLWEVQVIPSWRRAGAGLLRSMGPTVLWIRVKDENSENSARVVPEPEGGACDWETWKERYFLLMYLGTLNTSWVRKGFLEFFGVILYPEGNYLMLVPM